MSNRRIYDLSISGKTADVRRFQEFLGRREESLDAGKRASCSERRKKKDVPPVKNSSDRDGWRSEIWGEGWGIFGAKMEYLCECENTTVIIYTFDTERSSPSPAIKIMEEKFPALKFELGFLEGSEPLEDGLVCRPLFLMELGRETMEKKLTL